MQALKKSDGNKYPRVLLLLWHSKQTHQYYLQSDFMIHILRPPDDSDSKITVHV